MYRATGSSEFAKNSIHGSIRHCSTRSTLRARPGRCTFCTNLRFTFLGSPFPYLHFHMHLALMQPLYRARSCSEFAQISIHGPIRHCSTRSSFRARPGRCAFCTNSRFTGLGMQNSLGNFAWVTEFPARWGIPKTLGGVPKSLGDLTRECQILGGAKFSGVQDPLYDTENIP